MKKFLKSFLIILFLAVLSTEFVFAQDDTEIRLQQIETKMATKSTKTTTVSSKVANQKAITFIEGSVLTISANVLTISSKKDLKTIYTSDSTKFINIDSGGKKLVGFGDIKVNDTILVVGVPPASSTGSAKLIIRDSNKVVKNFSILGKIATLKENTLTLGHFSRSDLPNFTINLTTDNIISSSKNKTLDRSTLITGQFAIITGIIDDKGSFSSKQIFLPNYKTKTATISGQ